MAVNATELELVKSSEPKGKRLMDRQLKLLKNVKVRVDAVLGDAEVTVNELYDLQEDSIVKLTQKVDEPVTLMLDGRIIAVGKLVAVDDNFGIQITQVNKIE